MNAKDPKKKKQKKSLMKKGYQPHQRGHRTEQATVLY